MKKDYKKAIIFYIGKDKWKDITALEMIDELNKKGFNLTQDMTLNEMFNIVYERYLKEKEK